MAGQSCPAGSSDLDKFDVGASHPASDDHQGRDANKNRNPHIDPRPENAGRRINSHQLNAVCREKGIWHLVYIGFAINWCLLASPGGMIDMSRMGYVCSTIRQATTAVENKETCSEEWAKEVALWRVALMFGYVFDVDPFVAALQGLPTS